MTAPAAAPLKASVTQSAPEIKPNHWPRYIALALTILLLTFLRRPGAFLWPTLYFEDGTDFYRDQLLEPSWSLLFRPYMRGVYALPIPRIAAFLAWWSPRLAPYIFNGIGLLIGAASCSVFALRRFRPILASDLSRIVLCVLSAVCLDNMELLTSASNSFWLLGLVVFLFAFVPPVALTRRMQALYLILGLAAAYSTPISAMAAPVALWGLWRNRSEGRWAFLTGLLIGAGVDMAIHLYFRQPSTAVSGVAVATAFLIAIGHRVVLSPIMGFLPAWTTALTGAVLPPLIGLVAFTAVVMGLLVGGSRSARVRCLLALFVLVVTMGSGVVNRDLVGGFQHVTGADVTYGGARYFYFPCCSFAYLVALAGEELFSGMAGSWRRILPAALTCAVFSVGAYNNFKGQNGVYYPWQTYADQISTWRASRNAWNDRPSTKIAPVVVPINMEPWYIWLPGNSLANGDFEDKYPSPWMPFDVGEVSVSRTVHHAGSASKKLSGVAGAYEDLAYLSSGTKYQISAYASTDQAGSAALWVTDLGNVQIADGPHALQVGQWRKFTVDFTASSANKMRVHLTSKGGTVYWDSVTVQ